MKRKRIVEIIFSFWLCSICFTANAQKTNAPQINAFSAKQAVEYAMQNAMQVKNALLDIEMQKQTNKEVTASAFPQITGTGSLNYNPNVAVQTFPNFIAAGTYGVLVAE